MTNLSPQLDVGLEELLLGTHADGRSEDLLRSQDVLSPKLEVGELDPELGEGEGAVRDQLEGGLVDLTSSLEILQDVKGESGTEKTLVELRARSKNLGLDLLKRSVEEPQEDVTPPEPLLSSRRHLSDRPFVHVPDLVRRERRIPVRLERAVCILLQTSV